jgi:hypothetical protein
MILSKGGATGAVEAKISRAAQKGWLVFSPEKVRSRECSSGDRIGGDRRRLVVDDNVLHPMAPVAGAQAHRSISELLGSPRCWLGALLSGATRLLAPT